MATFKWTWLNDTASYRQRTAMCYDPVRQETIMFGGWHYATPILNDTWRMKDGVWSELSPATVPSVRWGHTLCWDNINNKILLFGGFNGSLRLNDLWSWDGVDWTQEIADGALGSPAKRRQHAMDVDEDRGVAVLYGGRSGGNETWELDLATYVWTQRTPVASPVAMEDMTACYDKNEDKLYLFGGTTYPTYIEQYKTYEWDPVTPTWIDVTPTPLLNVPEVGDWLSCPMVYNSKRKKIYALGPYETASETKIWEWNPSTPEWILETAQPYVDSIHPTVPPPNSRSRMSAAYDEKNDILYMANGGVEAIYTSAGLLWSLEEEAIPVVASGILFQEFNVLLPIVTSGILFQQFEVVPIELSYHHPVPSARTEGGGDAAPYAVGSLSSYTSRAHADTNNLIEGWKWDQRVWYSLQTENIDASVPLTWTSTVSGITPSYFQSGIGSGEDLELQQIVQLSSSGLNQQEFFRLWVPEINHGYYYDYSDNGYLFSDDSEILYPSYSGVVNGIGYVVPSGFNEVELLSEVKPGSPIIAKQFSWNDDLGKYETSANYRKKINFTGVRDSDLVRVSTYNERTEEIIWSSIDRSVKEFIVVRSGLLPKAIFNQQCVEEVGSPITSDLELVGISDGSSSQKFHLEYMPVDDTMGAAVYSMLFPASGILASGVIQWEVIPIDSTISGYQVKMDYDLGTILFGDSTVSGQFVPAAGEFIGVNYWKTVRLEYEPEHSANTVLATETNINPIYRQSGTGFIYLSTEEEDPTSITLEADLPQIQLNVFGPLYLGNNFAPIIATVKDRRGRVLEDQVVRFFLTSLPVVGSFGLYGDEATAITDYNGEARAFYHPPRSIDEIGEEVTASGFSIDNTPTYSGVTQTTIFETNKILIAGDLSDIFLYQIRVDDALLGFMETTLDQNDIDIQTTEYYRRFFEDNYIYGPTGLPITTQSQEWEYAHRILWNLVRPSIFKPNQGMGRRVLVAAPDTEALNPHTFTSSAFAPMQPIDVVSIGGGIHEVVFDTSIYSIPVPSGTQGPVPSGIIHSYFIVSPTNVTMQASVYNRRLNRTILSNEIQVDLRIPPYLSGLWFIDEINETHIEELSPILSGIMASGQKVPLGFRLRSPNLTLAGALDGVTFLDVNPEYNCNLWDAEEAVPLRQQFRVNSIV